MAGERGPTGAVSREPFDVLFETLPMAAWVYDGETLELLAVNDAAVRLYGYGREALLGMRVPEIEPTAQMGMRTGVYESDHLTRTGRLIEVEVRTEATTWKGRHASIAVVREIGTGSAAPAADLARDVVASAREAIVTVDSELTVTSINPAGAAMFRVKPEDAIGGCLNRFIPSMYRQEYRARLLADGWHGGEDGSATELLLQRSNGEAFVAEAGVARTRRDEGALISLILRDRTHQRAAEAALRDSERRYQLLASVAPVGIFRLDGEGRCIYANERLATMTGGPQGELRGVGWTNVVHPDDRHLVMDEWAKALRTRKAFHFELRLLGPNGRARWVLVSARAEEDEEGAVRSYVGTVIDISRRRAVEAALRDSEALYHRLTAVAAVGIFRLDLDGKCTYANARAAQITGRDGPGVSREDWVMCVGAEDRARVGQAWEAMVTDGAAYEQAFRLVRSDGTSLRVFAAMVPERDDDGRIAGFLGTLTDLTATRDEGPGSGR